MKYPVGNVSSLVEVTYSKRSTNIRSDTNMLPIWIQYTMKYYSLLGFHSIPDSTFGGQLLRSMILFIQIGCCSWCSFWTFRAFVEEQTRMAFLDALNFFLYYLTCASTYWLILYDSYTKQNVEHSFWKNVIQISEKFYSRMTWTKWNFLSAFCGVLAVDCAMISFSLYRGNTTHIVDKMMHFTFVVIVDHWTFFYLLHLKVLAYQLQCIETELERHRTDGCPSLSKGQWIRENFRLVYEMADSITDAFGWSNVALQLLSFHSSVTFSNFIYRQAHQKFYNLDTSRFS